MPSTVTLSTLRRFRDDFRRHVESTVIQERRSIHDAIELQDRFERLVAAMAGGTTSTSRQDEFFERLLGDEIVRTHDGHDLPSELTRYLEQVDARVSVRAWHRETEECGYCGDRCYSVSLERSERHDSICSACRNEYFDWSDRIDAWVHRDDWDPDVHEDSPDDEDDDSFERIHRRIDHYNADPLSRFDLDDRFRMTKAERERHLALGRSAPRPLWLGVELEVTVRPSVSYSEAFHAVRKAVEDFAIIKHDGSVHDCNGFEIATVAGTLAWHREAWRAFFDQAAKYVRGWNCGECSCGLHVHVDRGALGELAAGKLMAFIHAKENRDFIVRVAGRRTDYAQFYDGTSPTAVRTGYRDHYDAAGPSVDYPTIEIRIFRANVAEAGFFKALEFVHALCRFCKQAGARELTTERFLAWFASPAVRKGYPALDAWLIKYGFIAVKKRRPEAEPVEAA